jgi:hypothetical protein
MRQLRSCDFCGARADGVYEVVPAELSPDEGEQRRVVLCANCLDTLETVVEPLLTRLGVGGVDGGASDRPAEPEPSPATTAAATDDADEPLAADESEPIPGDHEPNGGTIAGVAEGPDDARARRASEPGVDRDAESAADTATAEAATEPAATEATSGEPPQFRKVMRLLNNREFPVDRSQVEALAANAYDLEDERVRDIIDYAVERGVLADDGGTLRRA